MARRRCQADADSGPHTAFYAADEAIFVGAAVLAETARVTAMALGG